MLDRFHRLRHDAIVGRDHEHHDIGDLGAARAHGGEGGMAGRIDEGDAAARRRGDLIGADVLGDAAGLAGRHFGRANGVKQRRLAVVDVAHDGDDGRARLQFGRIVRNAEHAFFDIRLGDAPHRVTKLLGDQLGGIGVDRVRAGRHVALLHEQPHHVDGALGHAIGQFLDGDRFGNRHFADDLFLRLGVAQAAPAPLAAAEGGVGAFTHFVGGKRGDDGKLAAALFTAAALRLGCGGGPHACAAGAAARARRFLFLLQIDARGARLGQRGLGAEALVGDLGGLLLCLVLVRAAFRFLQFARFRVGALLLLGGSFDAESLGIQLGALALFNLDLFRLVEGGGAGAKLRLSERAQHDARLGLRGNDRRRRFGRRRSFAGGEAL